VNLSIPSHLPGPKYVKTIKLVFELVLLVGKSFTCADNFMISIFIVDQPAAVPFGNFHAPVSVV
jgi:hypothetical protein